MAMIKTLSTFLIFALIAGAAMARPDVDLCIVDMARDSRVRGAVWPKDIDALCILADRGYLNTDVAACVNKLHVESLLGRQVAAEDAGYVCGFIGDMVKRYIVQK